MGAIGPFTYVQSPPTTIGCGGRDSQFLHLDRYKSTVGILNYIHGEKCEDCQTIRSHLKNSTNSGLQQNMSKRHKVRNKERELGSRLEQTAEIALRN